MSLKEVMLHGHLFGCWITSRTLSTEPLHLEMAAERKMWVLTEDSLDPMDVSSSDMNKWEQLDFNIEINYILTCFFPWHND